LSVLVSSIDCIVRPTNGNYEICGQAKKMLQTILDIVLSADYLNVNPETQLVDTTSNPMLSGDVFDDQMWLNNDLDMDFWMNLADHPLLTWPELT